MTISAAKWSPCLVLGFKISNIKITTFITLQRDHRHARHTAEEGWCHGPGGHQADIRCDSLRASW